MRVFAVALSLFLPLGAALAAQAEPIPVSQRLRGARELRTKECSPAFTALMRAKVSRESCTAAYACEHYLNAVFGEFPTYCIILGSNLDQANVRLETCRQKSYYDSSCDLDSRDRDAFRALSVKFRSRILNKLNQKNEGAAACESLEKDFAAGKLSGKCREEVESIVQARHATAQSAGQLAEMLEKLAEKQ